MNFQTDSDETVRDAMRYRAIKEKIRYARQKDGMVWATLDWCVEIWSMSPENLDDAIDQILLKGKQ